ncbi:hypothetical protein SS50377_20096 [Spironucleus salmonicida]|uniref:Uncharacterized protein n=1 Tax=Spironucleus salmonicida TaxID=348837 RepID=A0A9P8LYW9_9EUKA|nr:hypothetical protein SS50377_20096 [Spironucleus salmonicida]
MEVISTLDLDFLKVIDTTPLKLSDNNFLLQLEFSLLILQNNPFSIISHLDFNAQIQQTRVVDYQNQTFIIVLTTSMNVQIFAFDNKIFKIAPHPRQSIQLDFSTYDIFAIQSGYFLVFNNSQLNMFSIQTGQKLCQLLGLVPNVLQIQKYFQHCECAVNIDLYTDFLDENEEKFGQSSIKKLAQLNNEYICDYCKTLNSKDKFDIIKILGLQDSDYYGNNALPSLLSLYAEYNVAETTQQNQWGYNIILDVSSDENIELIIGGNIPEIVYYQFPQIGISNCIKTNTFITVYPVDRILGLKQSTWLQESLFNNNIFKSTIGQNDCDLFSDDINDIKLVSKNNNNITLQCFSMLTGIFQITIITNTYKKGNVLDLFTSDINNLSSYENNYINQQLKTDISYKLLVYNAYINKDCLFNGVPQSYHTFLYTSNYIAFITKDGDLIQHKNKIIKSLYIGPEYFGIDQYNQSFMIWSNKKIQIIKLK